MMGSIPEELWAKGDYDKGQLKCNPIEIKIKQGCQRPFRQQYKVKQEAEEGIEPVIRGLKEAGILVTVKSACNTPILPVKKTNGKWRMVYDLRAVNDVVQEIEAVVPNLYQLLNNIGDKHEYFSTIDLTSAFCNIPLSEQSRQLFAFTLEKREIIILKVTPGIYTLSTHI